jgi:hypothetical protein
MSAPPSIGSSSSSLLNPPLSQNTQPRPSSFAGPAFQAAAKAVGVDPAKVPGLEAQVQQAVQAASQSGDDPAAAQQALDRVLRANGLDPVKFRGQFQQAIRQAGGRHHHGQHGHETAKAVPSPTSSSTTTENSSGAGINTFA